MGKSEICWVGSKLGRKRRNFYCAVCNKPFCSQIQMEDHFSGRKHQKMALRAEALKKGLPLPANDDDEEDEVRGECGRDGRDGPRYESGNPDTG